MREEEWEEERRERDEVEREREVGRMEVPGVVAADCGAEASSEGEADVRERADEKEARWRGVAGNEERAV